jgi:hypothetical protein
VPLGCLFAFGGPLMAVIACLPFAHIGWLPFLQTDFARRTAMVLLAVPLTVMGVGLWRRSKVAWYAVFAYIGLCTAMLILSWQLDPSAADEIGRSDVVSGSVFNVLIGIGIFLATRPVFLAVPSDGAGLVVTDPPSA